VAVSVEKHAQKRSGLHGFVKPPPGTEVLQMARAGPATLCE